MRLPGIRMALLAAGMAVAPLTSTSAQTSVGSPDALFRLHSPSVTKVEVFEVGATAPASVGTAFYVQADGILATNYHVVRDVVYEPEGFTASVILSNGRSVPATVVAVSGPDDLALLSISEPGPPLAVRIAAPDRGAPLYSFGHPADLAQAIVEGNFNGEVEHRISARYHFTGSLNPGMSGGPAVSADGAVVGVNVATAGNQLSFLVPGEQLARMMARYATGEDRGTPLLEQVRRQFGDAADAALRQVVTEGRETRQLGSFTVPWADEDIFDCGAGTVTDDDDHYDARRHDCSAGDQVLVTQEGSLELVGFTHFTLESEELNALRFLTVESIFFQNTQGWLFDEADDVTDYDCERANVQSDTLKLRVAFCARANRELEGLHDVLVRSATLGGRDEAVVSTLTMAGVRMETARDFVASWLLGFGWES